jgi:hypothetical protein
MNTARYACRLALETKLAAVLKDESAPTLAMPSGLSGSQSCTRCRAYTASAPIALKASSAGGAAGDTGHDQAEGIARQRQGRQEGAVQTGCKRDVNGM